VGKAHGTRQEHSRTLKGCRISPQIFVVIVDAIAFEKLHVLFLECSLAMVLDLILNVCLHRFELRSADCKPAISILPPEGSQTEGVVNPFRRRLLNVPHHVSQTMRRADAN